MRPKQAILNGGRRIIADTSLRLVRGEQNLSIDIATKLSRMFGTTIAYWLNLQQAFDEKVAEFLSEEDTKR